MWQTGGPPVLHRIAIVKLLTQHVIKRRLLGTHQWQSALLVVGLPVTHDWFEMSCHLSPSLISIKLTACRTSIPRKRRGNHKQELRRFFGLIAYQRRFVKNAAFILDPLNSLLKGRVKNSDRLRWPDKADEAFIAIKRKLVNITYLAHPKGSAILQLKCDASIVSLGSCLEQVYHEKTEVLGYFSRSLQDAQQRYSTYDFELLSVYNSVKYFEHMSLDKHFIIFTDNKSLVNSFCKPSESHTPHQVRQLSYLSQFDCKIRHLPGHLNVVADCLSRVIIQNLFWAEKPPFTLEELVKAQQCIKFTKIFLQAQIFN